MRIAYLVNIYPSTSQSFIRREIHELESQGFEVERFATRKWDQPLVDEADIAEQNRTRVIQDLGKLQALLLTLQVVVSKPAAFFKALKLVWTMNSKSARSPIVHFLYLVQACVLRRWLAKNPVEHVHVHFATNATEIAMLCHELGGPTYSFMVHGPEEIDRAVVLGMDEKVSRARFVTVITDFCRSQMYRWSPHTEWHKIHIVHCGLDSKYITANPTPPSKNGKLLNIGRICEQKGQLLLMQAAAKLVQQGREFELTVVGDGSMRGELEAFIEKHELGNHVKLVGWQTNAQVQQRLLDCQTMVLPSFAEGLPVVIMESLALQRPVITTYIAGIPELVDEECGWIVPAGAVDATTDAMAASLDATEQELRAMGKVGAKRVRERHDVTVEARKLAELIRGA